MNTQEFFKKYWWVVWLIVFIIIGLIAWYFLSDSSTGGLNNNTKGTYMPTDSFKAERGKLISKNPGAAFLNGMADSGDVGAKWQWGQLCQYADIVGETVCPGNDYYPPIASAIVNWAYSVNVNPGGSLDWVKSNAIAKADLMGFIQAYKAGTYKNIFPDSLSVVDISLADKYPVGYRL